MLGLQAINEMIDINSDANREQLAVGRGVKRLWPYNFIFANSNQHHPERTIAHRPILYSTYCQKNGCSVLFWYHGMIKGCSFTALGIWCVIVMRAFTIR